MLQFIRDRAQGWLAWVIVILIIIPFALWGINQYFGGGKEPPAAVVNGVEIGQQQLQQAWYQQRQRIQQMLGSAFRPEMFPESEGKRQVLQQLIEQELLVQQAAAAGLRVGDVQLAQVIHGIEAFQEDGRFSPARYEQLLAQQGMQPGFFEYRLRRDLIADQLRDAISATALVTTAEQQRQQQLTQQQREVGWLTFPVARYLDQAEVSDEALQAYYDQHATRFSEPERVRIAWLELDSQQLATAVAVSEESLQQRYEAQQINFRTPEQRQARHILLEVAADADSETEAAVRSAAEALLARLKQGEDFATLAAEASQDPGSAEQGGDLGWFGRGVMDPAFEETTFALQPGELSEPVRSSFGYHLIELQGVRGGEVKPFAQVREQLATELRREQADQHFYELAEQLATLTYEHPEALLPAAEQLELKLQESDWLSREGTAAGITAEPKVIQAAFSEELRRSGYNSEVIELAPTHLVVLRPLEHREASRKPLAEVRDEVFAAVQRQIAERLAQEAAAAALTAIAAGGEASDFATPSDETAASESAITWQPPRTISRESRDLDPALITAAFAMPRPAAGSPNQQQRLTLGGGDEALLLLFGVTDGAALDDEAAITAARQRLQQQRGEAAFEALLSSFRANADIVISR